MSNPDLDVKRTGGRGRQIAGVDAPRDVLRQLPLNPEWTGRPSGKSRFENFWYERWQAMPN